jgi:large subunit ribosomal protein L4
MATLPVFNRAGKEVGSYELDPTMLAPHINKQLLHDVVVMYQANLRLGTHRTKSRAEVAGSTKKMYRQKGTGNARAGSRRSGVRRGGGHIFAKRPRDWSYRLPRKAVQLATRMALASKIRDEQIVIIDELAFQSPKTKDMAGILRALKCEGTSCLVATATHDPNVYKSARNIDKVTVSPVADLNALSVLTPRKLLVTRAALDAIKQRVEQAVAEKKPGGKKSAEAKSSGRAKKKDESHG